MSARLCDEVRSGCAQIAASARWVSIDLDALAHVEPGAPPALDPVRHFLDGSPQDVASYFLTLDAINFGSGWFPTLRKRPDSSGYFTVAWALSDRFRAHGPWTPEQLQAIGTTEIAETLGQPLDHELMALYAQALRALGRFLGGGDALALVRESRGSAERLATQLARGMALFDDRGFYKRAQIVPANLALAGIARFRDLDRLTIFADNLVPHVLRCDGVLRYDERLAAHIDAGLLLPAGDQEREIRACAVRACELIAQRLGATEHELDNWLWSRGQAPAYKARFPRHRTRTVYY
ncbi:MAG TPA: queuosine salvage family protein [Solirubrobacteraceae bacterium]|nr:queuosine salvage family protein [Solirubrobacteraceae bacterium]